jgi:hypothetical protein
MMAKKPLHILECYRGITGHYYWRLIVRRGGKTVEDGAESYSTENALKRAVFAKMKRTHPDHLPEVRWLF